MLLKILNNQEKVLENIECPEATCQYHGEKFVCYSVFYDQCKHYEELNDIPHTLKGRIS